MTQYARRPQPVAIEHRADDRAVGERDRRRTIPRLHQRCVELVVGPPLGREQLVVLPRLGDHHQHGFGQRVAAHVQQLDRFVEAHRVAAAGSAHGEQAREIAGDQIGRQQRFARAHPVAVGLHRVDLAVVGDESIRMRERPRREGVGREAAVHERDGRLDPAVGEIGEERQQLPCREHALVDERARRQRGKVDAVVRGRHAAHRLVALVDACLEVDLVLDALAHRIQATIEGQPAEVVAADEELREVGHRRAAALAEDRRIDRHFAPAEHLELFALDDLFDVRDRLARLVRVLRQEGDAGAVVARRWQVEVDDRTEETIGHLDQDAGAVAGPLVGAEGAAMVEVAQRGQTELDDAMAATAAKVGHEADAARVVFEPRVVQSFRLSVETHQNPREWYTDISGPGRVDASDDAAG